MRTKAIIIKKTPANEFDQLISMYSEDFGTLRAIARGIYRPTSIQSMHLETLNLVEFELVNGRALPIIASAQMIDQFPGIKSSLRKLAAVQFFTEVVDKISFENEKDPKLWEFLKKILADINSSADNQLVAKFRAYQTRFLDVLGYAPQVSRCVVCSQDVLSGPEKMVALNPELGGVVCGECFLASGRGVMFDKRDLSLLTGSSTASSAYHGAIDTFFEYTVGKKLNSLVFLYSVLK